MLRAVLACTTLAAAGLRSPAGDPGGGEGALEVYARGDYAAAVKLLEPDYRAGKATIQERILLARAYRHLARDGDALAVLRSVLESDSENPEANGMTGALLHAGGKHAEAVKYLQHALRLKPDPATASTLGKCHYALGQLTEAKACLQTALKEDVRDPSNSFLLGRICLDRGQGALAEKYLLMAQEAGLESRELHLRLGKAYVMQRKLTGPILLRRLADPAAPGRIVEDHVVLARLAADGEAPRYQVCSPYSALHEGLLLLKDDPDDGEALFMAAAGWFAAGDVARAEAHLKRLTAREPASRRVVDLRARILIARGDPAALDRHLAHRDVKKALGDEGIAEFYYRAALAQRGAGKPGAALRMLRRAEGHCPTSAKVLRGLGSLSRATGKLKEARGYYARMVELFPDAPDIDELRNILKVLQEQTGGRS